MSAEADDVSDDGVLGGALVLRQPRRGHRFGHDAVLLAAAVPARRGELAIELGAGVGAAGLALAHRVEGLGVTLVEIDPFLVTLAAQNAARNRLDDRVRTLCLDVGAGAAAFAAAGLKPGAADHVLMNPPFNPPQNPSPDPRRRLAYAATDETLGSWLAAAASLLRPAGVVTMIWRASDLEAVLASLGVVFGKVTVLPIRPKPAAPAIRIVLRALKNASGPVSLLPDLVLANADGQPTDAAESVLRRGAALAFDAG
jgi:tRNA1(Val) A37 N6-methylase TrmN6